MIRLLFRLCCEALREIFEDEDDGVMQVRSHVIPVPAEMSSKDAWDEIVRFGQLAEGKEVPEEVDGDEGEDRWAVVLVEMKTNEYLAEIPDEVLDESMEREVAYQRVRGITKRIDPH